MLTKILTDDAMGLELAADYLREGKTVVFPTETVYGLGANALDENAVKKIFKAKGRPSDNPLIIHISSLEMLDEIAEDISDTAKLLIDRFWPGPLTLIFKKKKNVSECVTAGLSTVAVRFPSNNVAYELIERAGIPVAAPSANISGRPSPTRFSHSYEDLNGRVDAIIKSEPCEVGVESTVLDVSGEVPVLLRPGRITLEEIEEIAGEVKLGAFDIKDDKAPMSPGMKYKHYAPKAEVIILKGGISKICEYVRNEIKKLEEFGETNSNRLKKLAVLNFNENIAELEGICTAVSLGSVNSPEEAAVNLFKCLRELDDLGAEVIYAPEIPDDGIWRAVQNRLYKAAGGNIIDLSKENSENKVDGLRTPENAESLQQPNEDMENFREESKDKEVKAAVSMPAKQEVSRILFVCTGNTCRSPMAEGLFNSMALKEGLSIFAASAGTYTYNNLPVSENSVRAMREIGLDISRHKSRQITEKMLDEADLVLTMTEEHSEFLNSIVPGHSAKIMTVAGYIGLDISVADPYGDSLEEYIRCRSQLEKIIKLIIRSLKKAKKA